MQGLRALPSVDRLLSGVEGQALVARHGRAAVTDALRAALENAREAVRRGGAAPDGAAIASRAAEALEAGAQSALRPVLNLTGTVLHTNLGRAVLAEAAIEAASAAMRHPAALEFDLSTGRRGERDALVAPLICELTGAEAATVVNNNAAALLLTAMTLAPGREMVVSRGELIEIGDGFRLPELLQSAGDRLVEVGMTNRTHLRDYENAIVDAYEVRLLDDRFGHLLIDASDGDIERHGKGERPTGIGLHAHGRGDLDGVGADREVDLHRRQRQLMAQRDQLVGALGGEDAGHPAGLQGIALVRIALPQTFDAVRRCVQHTGGTRTAPGIGLVANVLHADARPAGA